jgi:hypothetical protein
MGKAIRGFDGDSGHEERRYPPALAFSDGARAVAAAKQSKARRPTEADLQTKPDARSSACA